MANMSYCRFQNTNGDLSDCQFVLDELENGTKHELSRDEFDCAVHLIERCKQIAAMFDDAHGSREIAKQLQTMIDEARFDPED